MQTYITKVVWTTSLILCTPGVRADRVISLLVPSRLIVLIFSVVPWAISNQCPGCSTAGYLFVHLTLTSSPCE